MTADATQERFVKIVLQYNMKDWNLESLTIDGQERRTGRWTLDMFDSTADAVGRVELYLEYAEP